MSGVDYDLDAAAHARTAAGAAKADVCGVCHKPMYKDTPYPGVPIEWRHRSTGHTISWNPSKHLAGIVEAFQHGHRFPKGTEPGGVVICEVYGCDTEMVVPVKGKQPVEVLTDKEAALQVSRKRGSDHAKKKAAKKGPMPPPERTRPLGGGVGF